MDPQRRFFLRGRVTKTPPVPAPRPPWALAEPVFLHRCSRCDACIEACPERILLRGDGGFPEVDFRHQGCTECGACVKACVSAALQRAAASLPWTWKPQFSADCLAQRKVECRVCGERCDHQAIRFQPVLGGIAQPMLEVDRCTGCGACVSPCPAGAITLAQPGAKSVQDMSS